MRTSLNLLAFVAVMSWCACIQAHPLLTGLIPHTNHRFATFSYVLTWLQTHPDATTIVETGTARNGAANCLGDGCSTVLFAKYVAQATNRTLYSVDINPQAVANAQHTTHAITPRVVYAVADSVTYLRAFSGRIDVAYLDSYDFDGGNPLPSQNHHLREIEAVLWKLKPSSLVLLDDCRLVHGGKCALVERYLKDHGFITVIDDYQKVFRPPTIEDMAADQRAAVEYQHAYNKRYRATQTWLTRQHVLNVL